MLALAMLKEGASITHVTGEFHMLKCASSDLKHATTWLPANTMPTRKAGTGTKKKTTDGTNTVWPRDVVLNPSITTTN